MANKDLKGKQFVIPEDIKLHLKSVLSWVEGSQNQKGMMRLKTLVDSESISYEQMKRIKNFFDNVDPNDQNDSEEYRLNGGDMMSKWVNDELENERFMVHRDKQIRADAGEKNQFKKSFTKGSKTMDREYLLDKIKLNEKHEEILKIMYR